MAKSSPYKTGELSDSMLLVLAAALKPAYGYQIMCDLKSKSEGLMEIGPATMYRILKNMKDVGWLREIDGGEACILYQATDDGILILKQDVRRRRRIIYLVEEKIR